MLCLEIRVNGELRHRAGLEEGVVVSAAVNLLIHHTTPGFGPDLGISPVTLTVSGIEGDERTKQRAVQWGEIGAPLALGDEVSIRIVKSGSPDSPKVTAVLPEISEDD